MKIKRTIFHHTWRSKPIKLDYYIKCDLFKKTYGTFTCRLTYLHVVRFSFYNPFIFICLLIQQIHVLGTQFHLIYEKSFLERVICFQCKCSCPRIISQTTNLNQHSRKFTTFCLLDWATCEL